MLTKEKYRINKREDINLTQTERTTDRIGKEAKTSQAKITTYKICTATPDKQQLLYKGEIQNFYTN